MNKKKLLIGLMLANLTLTNIGPFVVATSVNDLQNEVDTANSTINENESSIESKQSEIDKLNSQISEIETKLTTKRDELDEVNQSIATLESDIADKQSSIDDTENSINDLKVDIADFEDDIAVKEDELTELEVELEKNKEMSGSILVALQKNSNVNYIVSMLTSDSTGLIDKINTLNGLNRLANDSFEIIIDTINVTKEVEAAKQSLETQKADLQSQKSALQDKKSDLQSQKENLQAKKDDVQADKDKLAAESDSLVAESQSLAQKEDQLAQEITQLTNLNADEKTAMLQSSNLLTKYQNAGCSGDDVYGVDCAVPTPTVQIEEQEEAQSEVTVDNSSESSNDNATSTSTGGSYVAKLKADPNANYIINRESGWNPYATNASSGAYGICQALPGAKMASAGSDWATNIETQAKWCDSYVNGRYGSWANARSFWDTNHWF